jgi:hypothetical protein
VCEARRSLIGPHPPLCPGYTGLTHIQHLNRRTGTNVLVHTHAHTRDGLYGLDDLPTYHAYAGPSARVNAPLVLRYHELVIRQQQQQRQVIDGFRPYGNPQAHAQMAPAPCLSSKLQPPAIQTNPQHQSMTNTVGANVPARISEGAPMTLRHRCRWQQPRVCAIKCSGPVTPDADRTTVAGASARASADATANASAGLLPLRTDHAYFCISVRDAGAD